MSPEEQGQEPEQENVTISKEDFNNLMSTITEMKTQMSQNQKPEPPKKKEEDEEEISDEELQNLGPKEAIELIVNEVGKRNQKYMDAVNFLMVREEVRSCRETYPDFDQYKDEIREYAKKNPGLSITQAYKNVKADKLTSQKNNENNETPPEKKKLKVAPSHKPGNPPVDENAKLDTRAAAMKALEGMELED